MQKYQTVSNARWHL